MCEHHFLFIFLHGRSCLHGGCWAGCSDRKQEMMLTQCTYYSNSLVHNEEPSTHLIDKHKCGSPNRLRTHDLSLEFDSGVINERFPFIDPRPRRLHITLGQFISDSQTNLLARLNIAVKIPLLLSSPKTVFFFCDPQVLVGVMGVIVVIGAWADRHRHLHLFTQAH